MQRNEVEIIREYNTWIESTSDNPEIKEELLTIKDNPDKIQDAFYKDLDFGTGGLRGVLGAGTNRMNIYTVSLATQGVASYIDKYSSAGKCSVAISYDSRINSRLFAETSARVLASRGIRVYVYSDIMPTPMLSWAVRALGCSAGIMITASHNPAKYNGFKVYDSAGCQITDSTANNIYKEIQSSKLFIMNRLLQFDTYRIMGLISWISEKIISGFIDAAKAQLLLSKDSREVYRHLSVVYTPLNGTGNMPVRRVLRESGFENVTVVSEQEQPDGNFPTCPYPNPEISEAMELGIQYAKHIGADLLVATDPDCDRVGIAVKNNSDEYTLLSANETGILLLNYICKHRISTGTMPENPIFIKTIVTSELAEKIAGDYGVHTINVLTGFKYIGEQIGHLEKAGHIEDFIFGFEESFGYLSGNYVRDKDGVGASLLICEMAAFYKTKGMTLQDALGNLYNKYGFYKTFLNSYIFEGSEGFRCMNSIMESLRRYKKSGNHSFSNDIFGNFKILAIEDYLDKTVNGLRCNFLDTPFSNVLKFRLENNVTLTIRPSGTEPKLKVYISVYGNDMNQVDATKKGLSDIVDTFVRKHIQT